MLLRLIKCVEAWQNVHQSAISAGDTDTYKVHNSTESWVQNGLFKNVNV